MCVCVCVCVCVCMYIITRVADAVPPSAIMSSILCRFSLSSVSLEAYRLKIAYCRAHTRVLWTLASEIVAGGNWLANFRDAILARRV